MRRRRRRHTLNLLIIVLVIAGIGYYFGLFQPVWDDINKGLDLVGGIHIVLEAQEREDSPITDTAMNSAMEVIRRRVDALGVTEPVIVREGARRIVVNLPGIEDPEEALEIIGRTARLEFTDEAGEILLTGEHLTSAQAMFQRTDAGGQQPVVSLQFDVQGTRLFADATEKHLNRRIIILLDDEVVQAPYVRSVIRDGSAVIEGYNSLQEAQEIAVVLNSGALPLDLIPLRPQFVSATLGEASINQSWQAALIAVAAVVALMVLFYRVPGVWAVIALGLYIVLIMVVLAGINATLTLPGIAGIILSIGMAVDANVIIFERIKEEVRAGATPRAAIDSGFSVAFRTIVDANVTTLIAAGVLYWLASGPIRGFAVTLSLGIVLSMFTAMVITRLAMVQMASAGLIAEGPAFFGSRRGHDDG